MKTFKSYELEACRDNVASALKKNELGRNQWLKECIELIDKSENINTIALDGDWGSGKTFLLKKLEYILDKASQSNHSFETTDMKINLNHEYKVVYYNCWRHDNGTDVIQDIITSIIAKYDGVMDKLTQQNISTIAKLGRDFGSEFSVEEPTYNLRYKSALEIGDTNQAQKIKVELMVAATQNRENRKNDIIDIISSINKPKSKRDPKQKVIVIIDGVDRCRAEHALKVLEDIKHFMAVTGVRVVYGVNIKELEHVVTKTRGRDFNSKAYVSKFFNYTTKLEVTDEMRDVILSGNCQYLRDIGGNEELVKIAEYTNREFSKLANRSLREMEKDKLDLRIAFKQTTEKYSDLSNAKVISEIMGQSFEILCMDVNRDRHEVIKEQIEKLYTAKLVDEKTREELLQ